MISDALDGTTEFELAWMELMRITALVKGIRDRAHLEGTRVGDTGFPNRHEEGEMIQLKLLEWEVSLPVTFMPVDPPLPLELLDLPILQHWDPIFYINTNIAVAMSTNPLVLGAKLSTLRSFKDLGIHRDSPRRLSYPTIRVGCNVQDYSDLSRHALSP